MRIQLNRSKLGYAEGGVPKLRLLGSPGSAVQGRDSPLHLASR